jgi:hypothetical protein
MRQRTNSIPLVYLEEPGMTSSASHGPVPEDAEASADRIVTENSTYSHHYSLTQSDHRGNATS